jgi:hypothetical protein
MNDGLKTFSATDFTDEHRFFEPISENLCNPWQVFEQTPIASDELYLNLGKI